MSGCGDPETLLDVTLEGLGERFGYHHSMVLVPDGERGGLTTIASRGYDQFGFGAEVPPGHGIIGVAAERRRNVRITDLSRGQRYIQAVRAMAGVDDATPIPLPALDKPLSQIALPLVARGRLVGVLFSESAERFTFRHRDEEALTVIAAHLATALSFSEERERAETGLREKAEASADEAGEAACRSAHRRALLSARRLAVHRQRLSHPRRAGAAAPALPRGLCTHRQAGLSEPRDTPRPAPATAGFQGQSGDPADFAAPATGGKGRPYHARAPRARSPAAHSCRPSSRLSAGGRLTAMASWRGAQVREPTRPV